MLTSRLARASLAASAAFLFACSSKPTPLPSERPLPPAQASRSSLQRAAPDNGPGRPPSRAAEPPLEEASRQAPELLRQRTESAARDVAPLLEKRSTAAEPSGVKWTKSDEPPARTTEQLAMPVDPEAPTRTSRPHETERDKRPAMPSTLPAERAAKPSAVLANKAAAAPSTQPAADDAIVAANAVPAAAVLNDKHSVAHIEAPAGGDALAAKLAKRIKDNPRDVEGHVDYQLLQYLHEEQVPQLNALSALPAEDREVVTAVMDGLSNFRNVVRADQNALLSRKIRPILEMADRLRSQSELSVPTIALCKSVKNFGVYQPIESPRFSAAKEHPAILYCEVENFASQLNGESKVYETKLSQELVLYSESGLNVWNTPAQTVADSSRNRRHDFYTSQMLKLPKELTIGRYLLKVTITDQQVSRVAEATLPIQIVAENGN